MGCCGGKLPTPEEYLVEQTGGGETLMDAPTTLKMDGMPLITQMEIGLACIPASDGGSSPLLRPRARL